MRRIQQSFEGGLRRVNTVGEILFRIQRYPSAAKYVTYYRLHVAYFFFSSCVGTFVLWAIPLTTSKRLPFISALYTSVAALATTGLQTVDSASFTYFHYCVILVLMILGSPILTSLGPVLVRRYYFHLGIRQFSLDRIQQQKLDQQELDTTIIQKNEMEVSEDIEWTMKPFGSGEHDDDAIKTLPKCYSASSGLEFQNQFIKHFKSYRLSSEPESLVHSIKNFRSYNISSEPEFHEDQVKHLKSNSISSEPEVQHNRVEVEYPEELDWKDTVVVDTQQALRTLEYRALVALSWIITNYLFAVSIIGFLLGSLYFISVGDSEVRILKGRGINPFFYAMYSSFAAFTNSGYSMLNDSMIPFASSSGLLLLYAILASIGNTLYAPVMRFLVWVSYKRASEKEKSVYEYLMTHPRRCYTHLFPINQTLWLVATYVVMTVLQMIFMFILEWKHTLQGLSPMQKIVVSYYQAVGTRNSGGLAVTLAQLAPALLFIFIACMYMAVYPLFLSRQTSHVEETDEYDDASILGLERKISKNEIKSNDSVLVNESRRLLATDTTYLVLAMFILCLSESRNIKMDPLNFSIFNIIFEVTSAYGNIGLSLGYDCGLRLDQATPCTPIPYSFSGAWSIVGRLIIIVITFLGRHRGLADNIDSAIRLPTKNVPHSRTTPSTPRRHSTDLNNPNVFHWNGSDHHPQMELSDTHKLSSHDLPPTPSVIHNVTLSLSFNRLQSNPSTSPPTAVFAFAPPPLPASPSLPVAASIIKRPEKAPTSGSNPLKIPFVIETPEVALSDPTSPITPSETKASIESPESEASPLTPAATSEAQPAATDTPREV